MFGIHMAEAAASHENPSPRLSMRREGRTASLLLIQAVYRLKAALGSGTAAMANPCHPKQLPEPGLTLAIQTCRRFSSKSA